MAENLQNEKNENQRLTAYITEMIKEIEEKAPILKRQKLEYEESVKTVSTLTTQLENSMMVIMILYILWMFNLISTLNL